MFKEILSDAFPLIEKFAPVIASVVGSPLAGGATMFALNLLGNAFDVKPSDVKSLGNVILDHPDNADKLQSLEKDFADYFKSGPTTFKMPTKAEINIKLEWDVEQLPQN